MNQQTIESASSLRMLLPNWPLPIWMVAITLAIGLAGGLAAPDLIDQFNAGFGRALGEFALILLPSFTLAATMDRHNVSAASRVAVAASPLAGAGMICPDTAYAALSPVAGAKRLSVAFGSYAGFKLLYPAGPLIVATGLGVQDDSLLLYGLALLVPVWAVGVLWAHLLGGTTVSPSKQSRPASLHATALIFSPFLLLALLLTLGSFNDFSNNALIDFLTKPKGALFVAAAVALAGVASDKRRDCLDTAIGRTAYLLLLIGLASALGAVLTRVVPLDSVLTFDSGVLGLIGLFTLTVLFKVTQGSSMATFAAVAPVSASIVAGMEVPAAAAVFTICVGSFVAILPNDSFYWLVRRDALQHDNDKRSLFILGAGSTLQAITGLSVILLAVVAGF